MKNTIGEKELNALPLLAGEKLAVPPVPFPRATLARCADSHILVFTPRIAWLTLTALREEFGVDPSASEPCMYNQDWYINEDFANRAPDGKWHLVRKHVREDTRAKQPAEIERSLSHESLPAAITCAFTFFAWWSLRNEALWEHDFLWCSDVDHNGDRIYVGRYRDLSGVNKNGFNIHRHLSLRRAYGAAPEILI